MRSMKMIRILTVITALNALPSAQAANDCRLGYNDGGVLHFQYFTIDAAGISDKYYGCDHLAKMAELEQKDLCHFDWGAVKSLTQKYYSNGCNDEFGRAFRQVQNKQTHQPVTVSCTGEGVHSVTISENETKLSINGMGHNITRRSVRNASGTHLVFEAEGEGIRLSVKQPNWDSPWTVRSVDRGIFDADRPPTLDLLYTPAAKNRKPYPFHRLNCVVKPEPTKAEAQVVQESKNCREAVLAFEQGDLNAEMEVLDDSRHLAIVALAQALNGKANDKPECRVTLEAIRKLLPGSVSNRETAAKIAKIRGVIEQGLGAESSRTGE